MKILLLRQTRCPLFRSNIRFQKEGGMLNFPYKDNRNYEWRAISKDLTISLVAVVVIVSILFSSLTYFIVSKKAKFQLDEKADDYISYLVDSLEMPLWNIDEEGVIKVGESYINNELVARLRITESIDNVIFDRTKEDKRNLINRSGEVTHNNKIVGHIELALTPRIYMENNRKLLWSSLITMLVNTLIEFNLGIILMYLLWVPFKIRKHGKYYFQLSFRDLKDVKTDFDAIASLSRNGSINDKQMKIYSKLYKLQDFLSDLEYYEKTYKIKPIESDLEIKIKQYWVR